MATTDPLQSLFNFSTPENNLSTTQGGPNVVDTGVRTTSPGINTGQLLGTGAEFLANFFANNAQKSGIADANQQFANSPVINELRNLRGLVGQRAGTDFGNLQGFNLGDRTNEIKKDLFEIARPDLESAAGRVLGQDFLGGTLGLDLGGRGSPLQQAFSKNLGSEIARANVLGSQQGLNEASTLSNLFTNDIDTIRKLAEVDVGVQQSLLNAGITGAKGDAANISAIGGGIGDILASLFGGGAQGASIVSSLASIPGAIEKIGSFFGLGGGGAGALTPGGVEGEFGAISDFLGSLGGSTVGEGGAGVTPFSDIFAEFAGGEAGSGVSAGETGGFLDSLFGEGGGLQSFLGGDGTLSQGISSLFSGAGAGVGTAGSAFAASPAFGALMGIGGPALIALLNSGILNSPGGAFNPLTGEATMPGDPIPYYDPRDPNTVIPAKNMYARFAGDGKLIELRDTPFAGATPIGNPKVGGNNEGYIPPAAVAEINARQNQINFLRGEGGDDAKQELNRLLSGPIYQGNEFENEGG